MTIQEILEAHEFAVDVDYETTKCTCGLWKYSDCMGNVEAHRVHVAEVLEQHMQEREAEVVRETSRYLQRIFPRKGLVNRADILADIEIAAGRLGRGIHANGRDKRPANGR